MNLHGLGSVRHMVRSISAPFRSGTVILLYHRVFEAMSDPQLLCVTPPHFEEHLNHLQQQYQVLSLRGLAETLRIGKSPRRAVVLTFDDGYADNLYDAKPLLERFGIPATVFVTTGQITAEREQWWDELDILLQPGSLPETLQLSIDGKTYRWHLGETSHYTQGDYERYHSWNVLASNDPSPRHSLYRSLHQLLRPLRKEAQNEALDNLIAQGSLKPVIRPTHRTLSANELLRLTQGGLVEVGAHTVTHPVLATLLPAQQRDEIQQSKSTLENILGHPITSFSYPYGPPLDYTAETVALVLEAGFACACSNFAGVAHRKTDLHQLPRMLVRDWDGDDFASKLRTWFK